MKKRYLLLFLVIFLVGCSLEELAEETVDAVDEEKVAAYNQALLNITEDHQTSLDKRYDYLERKIDKVLDSEEELDIAKFTQIKIELNLLTMRNYTPSKVNSLSNKFKVAFTRAQELAVEKIDYSGMSLNDRYYSLNRRIEKISAGEIELKVSEYLRVEEELKNLEQDEYPLKKVTELRGKLFKSVIAELESAIIDYEIPEEELIEEEPVVEEVPKEKVGIMVPLKKNESIVVEKGPKTYVVELIQGGFDVSEIRINVNDTIKWRNARTGRYKIGLVIGNTICRHVKSKIFGEGESYNATFTRPGKCYVSDGIYTTQAMKIIIED